MHTIPITNAVKIKHGEHKSWYKGTCNRCGDETWSSINGVTIACKWGGCTGLVKINEKVT